MLLPARLGRPAGCITMQALPFSLFVHSKSPRHLTSKQWNPIFTLARLSFAAYGPRLHPQNFNALNCGNFPVSTASPKSDWNFYVIQKYDLILNCAIKYLSNFGIQIWRVILLILAFISIKILFPGLVFFLKLKAILPNIHRRIYFVLCMKISYKIHITSLYFVPEWKRFVERIFIFIWQK